MDPLTLAAITGGFSAVKTAVQGVRSALQTADDVGAIAGQIDKLFTTHSEAAKRVQSAKKNKLPNNKWAKFLKFRLKDDSDDETSLANVAAAKLAEKQQEEEIKRLAIEINRRFGANTWSEILDAQEQAKKEKAERLKEEKKRKDEEAARRALNQKGLIEKILLETGKVIFVLSFVVAMIAAIVYMKENKPPPLKKPPYLSQN
tara:strand:+ start:2746 stop:3354 length:609 start_codon:yes stop_codon:yes gene_type:complete